jgi:hypothetical protein
VHVRAGEQDSIKQSGNMQELRVLCTLVLVAVIVASGVDPPLSAPVSLHRLSSLATEKALGLKATRRLI